MHGQDRFRLCTVCFRAVAGHVAEIGAGLFDTWGEEMRSFANKCAFAVSFYKLALMIMSAKS
jgi:hypothetical protein